MDDYEWLQDNVCLANRIFGESLHNLEKSLKNAGEEGKEYLERWRPVFEAYTALKLALKNQMY